MRQTPREERSALQLVWGPERQRKAERVLVAPFLSWLRLWPWSAASGEGRDPTHPSGLMKSAWKGETFAFWDNFFQSSSEQLLCSGGDWYLWWPVFGYSHSTPGTCALSERQPVLDRTRWDPCTGCIMSHEPWKDKNSVVKELLESDGPVYPLSLAFLICKMGMIGTGRSNEIIHVQYLAQRLAHSRCSINRTIYYHIIKYNVYYSSLSFPSSNGGPGRHVTCI